MATSKKVTELTAITTAANADLVYIVHDPAGVPVSRKITVQNLLKDANSILLSANAYTNAVAAATTLAATAYSNSTARAAEYANSAYNNAVLYVNDLNAMLSPNIAYTGVFNDYPSTISLVKDQALIFTDTNFILTTPHLYWLANSFTTADYDLSGIETLDFRNIGGINSHFRIGGKSEVLLTSVNLHDITYIADWALIRDLPSLATFSANSLVHVANYLEINNMDAVDTQFNFPNLKTVGTLRYNWNNVLENTPQFPALTTARVLDIYQNSALQNTMTFDSLESAFEIYLDTNIGILAGPVFPALIRSNFISVINNDAMIDPIQVPVLETVTNNFYFYNNDLVTTAPATPSLISVGNVIDWSNNPMMVNGLDFSSLKSVGGDVYFNNCALDETSINYILTTLASLDGTNGTTSYDARTIELNGGTNAVPGTAGLEAIAILEGRGCTVNYNI